MQFTFVGQSMELRTFLNPDQQTDLISDKMPFLLDRLLNKDYTSKDLEKEHMAVEDIDVEFLKLGLAYHISRKQDSLRLSTKIIVKNTHTS